MNRSGGGGGRPSHGRADNDVAFFYSRLFFFVNGQVRFFRRSRGCLRRKIVSGSLHARAIEFYSQPSLPPSPYVRWTPPGWVLIQETCRRFPPQSFLGGGGGARLLPVVRVLPPERTEEAFSNPGTVHWLVMQFLGGSAPCKTYQDNRVS